jgi:Tfp pilus assembly protein PilF
MSTVKEHLQYALKYLRDHELYMAENELESALHHYLIEMEKKNGTSCIKESI